MECHDALVWNIRATEKCKRSLRDLVFRSCRRIVGGILLKETVSITRDKDAEQG